MVTRRQAMGLGAATLLAAAAGCARRPPEADLRPAPAGVRVPHEGEPHRRTWMAWPAREDVWGEDLDAVRDDIARIALAVTEFEPVRMLVDPDQLADARRRTNGAVELTAASVDDCWTRDSGPVFAVRDGRLAAVDLGFNGWGGKQVHDADRDVARRLAGLAGASHELAGVVGEGGGIEFDGAGTALACESSWVTADRNPGRSREDVTDSLIRAFGLRSVVWLPGGWQDITDGHIDGFARFLDPGRILVELPDDGEDVDDGDIVDANWAALQAARTADGEPYELVTLRRPASVGNSDDFAATRVNFLLVNGGLVVPSFPEDPGEPVAFALLASLHPDRRVVGVPIPALAEGGGAVHCVTQQEPLR